ncbi:MAG: LPS assembly lipoprotein LptE [Planctomycetes bacterium]|nr:LPS assembly lipoprotein LptE [Planctomycetota bacterium]
MPGTTRRFIIAALLTLAVAGTLASGCRTSVSSGLPPHIRLVEVHIFQNKTMYKSIEAWITRDIIDRINLDPRIRVVSNNGDAVITGEIVDVRRETLRETTTNEPGTVRITIEATYSFYDQVRNVYIIEDAPINSAETGSSFGIYEYSRGGQSEEGERSAARAMAGEIVRRTIGMW